MYYLRIRQQLIRILLQPFQRFLHARLPLTQQWIDPLGVERIPL